MEHLNNTNRAQKTPRNHHIPPIAKKGGKQEALVLTGYSAPHRHKTQGEPQESSSSCKQTAYRALGRCSAPPARSTPVPAKHAYYDLKVCTLQ